MLSSVTHFNTEKMNTKTHTTAHRTDVKLAETFETLWNCGILLDDSSNFDITHAYIHTKYFELFSFGRMYRNLAVNNKIH